MVLREKNVHDLEILGATLGCLPREGDECFHVWEEEGDGLVPKGMYCGDTVPFPLLLGTQEKGVSQSPLEWVGLYYKLRLM